MNDQYSVIIEYSNDNNKQFAARHKLELTVQATTVLQIKEQSRIQLEKQHPGAVFVRLVSAFPIGD